MTADPRLFDVPDPEPVEQLSYGRRLTLRNQAAFEQGRHPATGLPLADNPDLTCGTCDHHVVHRLGHTYHKCKLHRLGRSHSEASDIRVKWRACTAYRSTL